MARIPVSEVRRFCVDCMTAVGTPQAHAVSLAEVLVEADHRGHFSHGINRLDMYVRDVETKTTDGSAVPKVLQESAATAWVDGNNALGPVVGNFCMDIAIKKAKDSGIGWVVAKGSNHYGIAGWYSMKALNHNMLGMSFTNTSPLMSPTRSKESALGTNPLSLAAPAKDGDSFVLDMATTAVAVGKIEVQRRKKEPIPVGWAQGPDGRPTTDADLAFKTSALMPLGGEERTSGYKGYGLALLVETFCGILAGSDFGPNIRKWMDGTRPANLGQCFIAINPGCFAPGFEQRMSDMNSILRNLEPEARYISSTPAADKSFSRLADLSIHISALDRNYCRKEHVRADPDKPVLVPGDPERKNIEKVNNEGGVLYHENQLKASAELAAKLNVNPMKTL